MLKGAELTYLMTEKELLAIVHNLLEFWSFKMGERRTVITDKKALFLLQCKLLKACLTCWILAVQEEKVILFISGVSKYCR